MRLGVNGPGCLWLRIPITLIVIEHIVDPVVIDVGIIERPAVQAQIAGFGPAHGREQRKARNIAIAARRHQLHLSVEQFLFGVQNIQNGPVADGIFGAHAFQRQAGRGYSPLRRLDNPLRCPPAGIGRTGLGYNISLYRDQLLIGLTGTGLCLPNLRGRPTTLVNWHGCPYAYFGG